MATDSVAAFLAGDVTPAQLLAARADLTDVLENQDPYSTVYYFARSSVYRTLCYPDLAIADAYKALLLAEEILDESGEYHERALDSLLAARGPRSKRILPILPPSVASALDGRLASSQAGAEDDSWARTVALEMLCAAQVRTAELLCLVGCLRPAYTTIQNAMKAHDESKQVRLKNLRHTIILKISAHFESQGLPFDEADFAVADLPDRGMVRREVYPWNTHELDRMSNAGLTFLNQQMATVAPKLTVKVVDLPDLANPANAGGTTKQLGVFANEDIAAGEEVLCERSLLTANMRDREPLCDACGSELPQLGAQSTREGEGDANELHSCPDCDDVAFCSASCFEKAMPSYHARICGSDIESLGKRNIPAARAADALYEQLLFRAMCLSLAQDVHPLDLAEVKFIWGDFQPCTPRAPTTSTTRAAQTPPDANTLPYDFTSQVLQPLHLLEQLDISPFEAPHHLAETWVYNTLLAKFRGTASARLSPRDGRPEVAAVHPLWCLANHACDPNVRWEWSGVIRFHARERSIQWTREGETVPGREMGIQKGEEILNHYVDVELPVGERREWGAGALGGPCKCERCRWEAGETATAGM